MRGTSSCWKAWGVRVTMEFFRFLWADDAVKQLLQCGGVSDCKDRIQRKIYPFQPSSVLDSTAQLVFLLNRLVFDLIWQRVLKRANFYSVSTRLILTFGVWSVGKALGAFSLSSSAVGENKIRYLSRQSHFSLLNQPGFFPTEFERLARCQKNPTSITSHIN